MFLQILKKGRFKMLKFLLILSLLSGFCLAHICDVCKCIFNNDTIICDVNVDFMTANRGGAVVNGDYRTIIYRPKKCDSRGDRFLKYPKQFFKAIVSLQTTCCDKIETSQNKSLLTCLLPDFTKKTKDGRQFFYNETYFVNDSMKLIISSTAVENNDYLSKKLVGGLIFVLLVVGLTAILIFYVSKIHGYPPLCRRIFRRQKQRQLIRRYRASRYNMRPRNSIERNPNIYRY